MRKGKKLLILGYLFNFILMLTAAVFSFLSETGKSFLISVAVAYILTSLNSFAGIISINSGYKKEEKSSINFILGSMIIRLFIMLIAVFLCLKFLEISDINFIFSIFFFYIFYLFIEILYLYFEKI
jgi:hypothetical protein